MFIRMSIINSGLQVHEIYVISQNAGESSPFMQLPFVKACTWQHTPFFYFGNYL